MKLYEIILLEAKEDYLANQYKKGLMRKIQENNLNYTPLDLVNRLREADPTGIKYLEWITKQFCNDNFMLEDLLTVREDLIAFEDFKARLPKKDINQYITIFELREHLARLQTDVRELMGDENTGQHIQNLISNGDLKIFFNNGRIRIFTLETYEGSKALSKGTRWCTSAEHMFDNYKKQGSLYVVFVGTEKYQFHFETSQFMTVNDQAIQSGQISEKDTLTIRQLFISKGIMTKENSPFFLKSIEDIIAYWTKLKQERRFIFNNVSMFNADNGRHADISCILAIINTSDKRLFHILNTDNILLKNIIGDNPNAFRKNIKLTKYNLKTIIELISDEQVVLHTLICHNQLLLSQLIIGSDKTIQNIFLYLNTIFETQPLMNYCTENQDCELNKSLIDAINKLSIKDQRHVVKQYFLTRTYKKIPIHWISHIDDIQSILNFFMVSKTSIYAKRAGYYNSKINNELATNEKELAASDPKYIKYAKREDLTNDYILKAIKINPLNLKYVPDDMVDDDMLYMFLRYTDSINSLKKLPDSKVSKDFTDQLIKQGYKVIALMYPDRYM